jgi:hypothetical protein
MLEQSMKNREKHKIENNVVSPDELITRPDGRSQKRTKKTNDTPPAPPPSTHEDEDTPVETHVETPMETPMNNTGIFTIKDAEEAINTTTLKKWKDKTRKIYCDRIKLMVKHIGCTNEDIVECFQNPEHVIGILKTKYKKGIKDPLNTVFQLTKISPTFRDRLGIDIVERYKTVANETKQTAYEEQLKITDIEEAVDIKLIKKAATEMAKTHKNSMHHLVVALYGNHPVRDNFGNVKMVYDGESVPDDNNNYYDFKNNVFYLRDYKTDKRYGEKQINFKPDVVKIIREQIKKNGKRKWLIEKQNGGERYANGILSGFVKESFEMSGVEFPKPLTINGVRHAYVANAIRDKNITMEERLKLAEEMMHSIEIATMIYDRRGGGGNGNGNANKSIPNKKKSESVENP